MKQQRELLLRNWAAKPTADVTGDYRPGANLRVDAAARVLTGGGRLLDLGCGAGLLGELVGDRFDEVCGLDISPRAVEAAIGRGVRARVWDLNETPYPFSESEFDVVAMLSVVQYVFDLEGLMQEIGRVLRPAGLVLIGFPNMRAAWRVLRLGVFGRMPRVSADPGYDGGTIHYFCRKDIDQLLCEAGFAVERTWGVFAWPRSLEAVAWRVPLVSGLVREFLSAEVVTVARRGEE